MTRRSCSALPLLGHLRLLLLGWLLLLSLHEELGEGRGLSLGSALQPRGSRLACLPCGLLCCALLLCLSLLSLSQFLPHELPLLLSILWLPRASSCTCPALLPFQTCSPLSPTPLLDPLVGWVVVTTP